MDEEKEQLIVRYCLNNAVEHGGTANAKSVLGRILANAPELRDNVLQVKHRVEEECERVNKMSVEEQKSLLSELGAVSPMQKIEKKGLTEMVKAEKGCFVVRFAPNPDGALHLGGARPAVINYEYAKKYNGRFILRFDDTDPGKKVPEKQFYKWIKEDLRWLGVRWDQEVIASKRLKIYYKYAEEAIKKGAAYVCTCDVEAWRKLKNACKPCECRSLVPQQNMARWKKMLNNKFKEGKAVLRIKTDLEARNPAIRDWAAFRIVDKPRHPLVKNKHLWPLFNFQSAIDDHVLGITHIMRGQEHSTNETKQQFLYTHMGWEYPVTVVLGRFSLAGKVLSKSEIREGIKKGIYENWDDLQLGTIRSLRRRGFQAEAIKQMIIDIGAKPSDVTISVENLAAYNRKIIDSIANRYFFVEYPMKITIKNPLKRKISLPLHPDKKTGKRNFVLSKVFYIEKADFDKYKDVEVRLKDLYNIKLGKTSVATSVEVKNIPKIHWLPKEHIEVRLLLPKDVIKGIGETNLRKTKIGDIIQFERFGFVRVEKVQRNSVVCAFLHN